MVASFLTYTNVHVCVNIRRCMNICVYITTSLKTMIRYAEEPHENSSVFCNCGSIYSPILCSIRPFMVFIIHPVYTVTLKQFGNRFSLRVNGLPTGLTKLLQGGGLETDLKMPRGEISSAVCAITVRSAAIPTRTHNSFTQHFSETSVGLVSLSDTVSAKNNMADKQCIAYAKAQLELLTTNYGSCYYNSRTHEMHT